VLLWLSAFRWIAVSFDLNIFWILGSLMKRSTAIGMRGSSEPRSDKSLDLNLRGVNLFEGMRLELRMGNGLSTSYADYCLPIEEGRVAKYWGGVWDSDVYFDNGLRLKYRVQ